jgi:GH15 family glucan-1,4-alpha-glucosidase
MAYSPIENYGIIGDRHTVALVGMDGSIDFMCFPHFDSPSIFARLLDDEKGGFFRIAPVLEDAQHKQLYLSDTNILLTRFLSEQGVAEISDFMPIEELEPSHDLVRRAKTVRGEVKFRMTCSPAFNYAREDHTIEVDGDTILFQSPNLALRLRSEVPLEIRGSSAIAEFTLGAKQTAAFVLEEALPGQSSQSSNSNYVVESFKKTSNYWHSWIGKSKYRGRWREIVNRSALTLKMLTSAKDGSIVAAPTFGLPETIGGERNWDYRYTWIRDASFTLYALIRLGYTQEAEAFMGWLEDRLHELRPDGSLQIMYALDGGHKLREEELAHLDGFRGSRPVRIGNGAYDQLQLDIYGELMDSVYLYDKYGSSISYDLWKDLVRVLDWVVENWDQPDEGIWEIRGGRQNFLYSRLMCWVALDRGIRLGTKRSFPTGSTALDASSLLMPLVKFISPRDPRWLSHLRAIEQQLVSDSLVYRYNLDVATPDGLGGEEGTFSMCSFWYVECLSRSGDLQKARFLFEKMLGYANHLGLYSEELGPYGEHLGNFPQAFTHLALISAAFDIDRRLSDAGDRG